MSALSTTTRTQCQWSLWLRKHVHFVTGHKDNIEMTLVDHSWPHMFTSDLSWPCVNPADHAWPQLTTPDLSWPRLTSADHLTWLPLTLCDLIWYTPLDLKCVALPDLLWYHLTLSDLVWRTSPKLFWPFLTSPCLTSSDLAWPRLTSVDLALLALQHVYNLVLYDVYDVSKYVLNVILT